MHVKIIPKKSTQGSDFNMGLHMKTTYGILLGKIRSKIIMWVKTILCRLASEPHNKTPSESKKYGLVIFPLNPNHT